MKIIALVAIVLDTRPLGLVTQKPGHAGGEACRAWYASLSQIGCFFFVPEIADYELRREFVRLGSVRAIERLEFFNAAQSYQYLPLTTSDVRLAAELWARVRNQGRTTAPPDALDGVSMIVAQSQRLDPAAFGLASVVVATANVGHLSALTDAVLWSDLRP